MAIDPHSVSVRVRVREAPACAEASACAERLRQRQALPTPTVAGCSDRLVTSMQLRDLDGAVPILVLYSSLAVANTPNLTIDSPPLTLKCRS